MLARTLGRTVEELKAAMTAEEFGYWQTLYRREPWGEAAEDLRAGIIASTIANVNRDSKRRPEPYKPNEFMRQPAWQQEEPEQEADPQQFFENLKNGH